jgi:hypothetical protein
MVPRTTIDKFSMQIVHSAADESRPEIQCHYKATLDFANWEQTHKLELEGGIDLGKEA